VGSAGELLSTHSTSARTAIIEAAGEALWLYLTDRGSMQIVCDCWLANLKPNLQPLTDGERAALREAGLPPPAAPNALRDAGYQLPGDPHAYRIDWSEDGEAARVLLEDEPIAFVDSGNKRGFHINIAVECPWGHAFDAELHERLFEVPS
jgi:hypothetical protein